MAQQTPTQKAKKKATRDEKILRDIVANRKVNSEVSTTNDSFVNYQQNIGVGADNPLSTATYGFNPITRQRTLLEWMYRGSWIAGKLVDSIADDMTRAGVDLLGELEPAKIEQIEERAVNLQVWDALNDANKWGRLYGGALAIHLIDGQNMEEPLDINRVGKGAYKGLLAVDRWMVEPSLGELITDLGPNLGLPKYYRFTSMSPAFMGTKVHHSRVIRFQGIKLPYWQAVMENLWGLSILERLWDRIIAFDSASNGAAQLVYKSYIRHYKIEGFREIMAAGGDALIGLSRQIDQMRRYQGIEGMSFMDMKDDLAGESHSAFGGLSDILIRFMEQCSGAEQIPLVRLFGQSPSGFSTGDTDLRNYYDTIDTRRNKELRIPVTEIYRLIAQSEGIKIPKGFGIMFRSLWQMNDTEKSELANKNLETIARAEEAMLIDKPTALRELKQQSKTTGLFTNITDEMIEDAENEPPPMPEGQEGIPAGAGGIPQASQTPTFGNSLKKSDLENLQNESANKDLEKETKEVAAPKPEKATKDAAQPITAAGIIYISGDMILLHKRSDNGRWAFPGGTIEVGETVRQAAAREFFEEMGKDVRSMVSYSQMLRIGPFVALVVEGAPFKPTINEESIAWGWCKFTELPENMLPEAKKLLEAVYEQRFDVTLDVE